jgi:glycosyltransferase involved in cell wall biosynthesis
MVPCKRLDQAIRVFTRNGRKLKVVGDGPEYGRLRRLAGANVEFCGRVSDPDLREIYARSAALIVPAEEDFGITMVESLASGKPVIALGRGGALEIVDPACGVLYPDPSDSGLNRALTDFDDREGEFEPVWLKQRASRFSGAAFEANFLRTMGDSRRHENRVSVGGG